MKDLRDRVQRCFEAAFPTVPREQLRSITRDRTEVWDSLVSLTLITLLEEEFDIMIEDGVVDALTSFDAVIEIVTTEVVGRGDTH